MDTMKLSQPNKHSKPANVATKKQPDEKFNEDEKKAIGELKKLYLETIKLDVELQQEIYNMEKSYEKKHNEIFHKRAKILDDCKKTVPGDSSEHGHIENFWMKVLKASYTEFISKRDEQILSHLTDIRSKLYNEPTVKFVIEFDFEPNEFFMNRILTKTYFLNCLPDPEDPLSYDGAEIFKCEGCQIEWKNNEMGKEKRAYSSFFDFFNPPLLPDDPEDTNYSDINAILQNDFELGFYLKERVIPKAVMFFTGEIVDCQSSDSEEESDDDDDENEEVSTTDNETANN